MSNPFHLLHRLCGLAADILLPRSCFGCGQASQEGLLCGDCLGGLPWLTESCSVCAVPVGGGLVCGHCLGKPPAFDATRAAFVYAFPVDRIVQGLKYRSRLAVAPFFADVLSALGPAPEDAVMLPMPLHVRRLRARGFNQAVEMARPLAKRWGVPLVLDGVERVRDVTPQAGLPLPARQANVRGAFRCSASFAGKTVLVVDDVMTTGATLEELARTLKRHGAARVENLVVARTPPPA